MMQAEADNIKVGFFGFLFFYAVLEISELFKKTLALLFLSWVNISITFLLKSPESLRRLFPLESMAKPLSIQTWYSSINFNFHKS